MFDRTGIRVDEVSSKPCTVDRASYRILAPIQDLDQGPLGTQSRLETTMLLMWMYVYNNVYCLASAMCLWSLQQWYNLNYTCVQVCFSVIKSVRIPPSSCIARTDIDVQPTTINNSLIFVSFTDWPNIKNIINYHNNIIMEILRRWYRLRWNDYCELYCFNSKTVKPYVVDFVFKTMLSLTRCPRGFFFIMRANSSTINTD